MTRRAISALVYADVNMNVIDGSSVWVQSSVETLSRAGCEVTLLLKCHLTSTVLIEPLRSLGVAIHDPYVSGIHAPRDSSTAGLTADEARAAISVLDESERFDFVLVRGIGVAKQLIAANVACGRLWSYVHDLPQIGDSAGLSLDISTVVIGSRYVLCQTEEVRTCVEALVPEANGRTHILPVMIPESDAIPSHPELNGVGLQIVYSGKFAEAYNTLEMAGLPELVSLRGEASTLHMIGDKVMSSPRDAAFRVRMQQALTSSPGVIWHGRMARLDAMALAAACDVGLSWRDSQFDDSLELSTKLLEYGILGLPVIVNRTPMHEDLLGHDYPLFVSSFNEVIAALTTLANDRDVCDVASKRISHAAQQFTIPRVAAQVRALLDRAFPDTPPTVVGQTRPLRVLIASHDLKFFGSISSHLRSQRGIEVQIDRWASLTQHDEDASNDLAEWADVIVCEWCGENAVWYSGRKRDNQRLIVRLHRFELYTQYPHSLQIDSVDRVVCITPYLAAFCRDAFGWPRSKVVFIPNTIDVPYLARPKLAEAEYTLGMIGIPERRKRVDLAFEVLAKLRSRDRRFQLAIKTRMPWEYSWIWAKPDERDHILSALLRLGSHDDLRGAVVFDDFGPDVAAFLRKVGFILSTSDDEGSHVAPSEGMASGAVPAILPWKGAASIYGSEWIRESTDDMADWIYEVVRSGQWNALRRKAQAEVRTLSDAPVVNRAWAELVAGNLPTAP